MKKFYFLPLSILLMILIGCAGAEFVRIERTTQTETRTVKKDVTKILQYTNPRFLDKVLSTLQLPDNLFNNIMSDDRIIVQSVDRNYLSDEDLQLVIYRGLVNSLLKRHLTVLDRDENILETSLAETDNQFEKSWLIYKSKYADSLINFNNAKVSRATKILGYRILEFGQTLSPEDEDNIKRIGVVELELRLVDANTTQLFYIDQVRNIYTDLIPKEEYQILADLHYEYVSDALPLVKKVQYKSFITPTTEEKTAKGEDVLELTFQRGRISSDVQIMHKESHKVVADFEIPSKEYGEYYYTYQLKLIDENNNPLPPGEYIILIDNYYVHTFKL